MQLEPSSLPLSIQPSSFQYEAGVDEVGRGALFGPVVAAAVILTPQATETLQVAGVKDSKQLSAAKREHLAQQIRQMALSYAIAAVSVEDIDRLNILQASLLAMRRAITKLRPLPTWCWIDGKQLVPELPIPQQAIVNGDQTMLAIAAASILAKVWRDHLIDRLARHYPGYDLASNKGYGTLRHRQALNRLGPSPCHRRSFKLSYPDTEA